MKTDDLLLRLGGPKGVSRIVFRLYDRVLASATLEPYFAGIDMRRLIEHQAKFLISIAGGAESHSNEELRRAHAGLGIDHEAFEAMLSCFHEAFEEAGIEQADIDFIMAELGKRKPCIVTQDPDSRVA